MATKASVKTKSISEQSGDRSTRLHYLDWLGVLLVLGVFLFHAVHPFDTIPWHIKNPEQSDVVTYFIWFFFMWGMPLFFLVAGVASQFALRRRSGRQFLGERVRRLLIPFFVGVVILSPIMIYLEQLHQALFEGSYFAFLPKFFRSRILAFSPRIASDWGVHLWFLGFLFLFSMLGLPLFIWFKRDSGRRFVEQVGRLAGFRGGILLFFVPLALVILLFEPIFPDEHDWEDFFFYFGFFLLGYIFYADRRLTHAVQRDRKLLVLAAIASVVALFGISIITGVSYNSQPGTLEYMLSRVFWALVAWSWTLLILSLSMRFLDFTNKRLEYLQEAQLPIFVLHQPVIIILAFYVVQWEASILPKLLIVVGGSFLITFGIYEFFIRRKKQMRTLFGMKPRRTTSMPTGMYVG